jgi:anti-sigma regulatory factor (Ser/Thr protein kinase)
MSDPVDGLSESYAAVPGSLTRARRGVSALAIAAGATRDQLDAIRLATSEAVTNAIVHAYRERPGEIHVVAAVAGSELWLLVADDGDGLSVSADKTGLGLGLILIAEACDELTIVKRSNGGTELRMRFRLGDASTLPGDYERGSVSSARLPACSVFSTIR